ncbi:MAG: lysophospholipid acyltransferase family protein [Oxalicibacterium faecigallinarum]|uniref:lysophospholipid acyltransferase family protein n=1 Tax=Oxalicibacterium faecigallinarum TaxID=573741 RepID=UPI002808F0C1|nr:lysophospholipid acyltransferase family protein [Oxalicibacterium faecigallinarum]MDQ7968514.1 lysophospholipid acyltransferase family protein [Oxalicibacterium faecigallinarum]
MMHLINRFKHVRNVLILFFSLLLLAIFMIVGSIGLAIQSAFLASGKRRQNARRVITATFRLYFRILDDLHILRLDLADIDRLQDERGLILTSNHPSLLDALLITSRLPNVVCIMKAQVLRNVLFGHGAKMAGYIPNDSIRMIVSDASRELTEVGSQLLLFPEGTRSRNGKINPFQGTVGVIARRTNADVQTIVIESESGFLGKGWPVWRAPAFPVQIRVYAGKRFSVKEEGKLFVEQLQRYYEQELQGAEPTETEAASVTLLPASQAVIEETCDELVSEELISNGRSFK